MPAENESPDCNSACHLRGPPKPTMKTIAKTPCALCDASHTERERRHYLSRRGPACRGTSSTSTTLRRWIAACVAQSGHCSCAEPSAFGGKRPRCASGSFCSNCLGAVHRSVNRLDGKRRRSGPERIEIISGKGRCLWIVQEADAGILRCNITHQCEPLS